MRLCESRGSSLDSAMRPRFLAALSLFLFSIPTAAQDIVPAGTRPELLWNDGEFTEGVATGKNGLVYFSDIGIAGKTPGRIMRFDSKTGKTTVRVADSGQSNGLFFDQDGELL